MTGQLSPREREVARLVAEGMTNRSVADELAISRWTVNAHLRRIFTKLNVTSRGSMVSALADALLDEPLEDLLQAFNEGERDVTAPDYGRAAYAVLCAHSEATTPWTELPPDVQRIWQSIAYRVITVYDAKKPAREK